MKNYYTILNISPGCSDSDIKRAYRRLAVQYHPDKNQNPEAEAFIREINEAYEVLRDPQTRAQYDQRLANPWAQVLEAAPAAPRHRDPAYRRTASPRAHAVPKKSVQDLMRENLRYILFVSWFCLMVSIVFFTDFLLPYTTSVETVEGIRPVRLKSGVAYVNVFTSRGEKIKVYPAEAFYLPARGESMEVTHTLLLHIHVSFLNPEGRLVRLAYLYNIHAFLPVMLFLASFVSVMVRKRKMELSFNLGVLSGLLLIVTYIFF